MHRRKEVAFLSTRGRRSKRRVHGHCKDRRYETVQSKRNNDLLSFQLHLIIDFVLTQRKLAHGPVKFPACSISHFAMNIINATGSTAKVNSAKSHIFSNPPKYFPAKISGHTVTIYLGSNNLKQELGPEPIRCRLESVLTRFGSISMHL